MAETLAVVDSQKSTNTFSQQTEQSRLVAFDFGKITSNNRQTRTYESGFVMRAFQNFLRQDCEALVVV